MAKGSGSTKKSTSSNPKGIGINNGGSGNAVTTPKQTAKPAKVNFGSAPENYSKKTITVNNTEYTISAVPTGYGSQQKRNGRFTVSYKGNHQDFRWGDYYGGYTRKSKAWNEVKDFIKKREKI